MILKDDIRAHWGNVPIIATAEMDFVSLDTTTLQTAGFRKSNRVLHAWNGQEAVELFKTHSPHLILMDINMPILDEYGTKDAIRSLSPDVPVIAVTAYVFASDEQKILSSDFDGYMAKPVNPELLHRKIAQLLYML